MLTTIANTCLSTCKHITLWVGFLLLCMASLAQNDYCSGALPILLPNGGYGIGTVTSTTTNFSGLTIQGGESFAPVNTVAGQDQQSAWYVFSLPTPRSVQLTLVQPGNAINPGDVGFAVYKTSNCLPVQADLYTNLPPVTNFGSSAFGCMEPGTYLVQVAGKSTANGPVFLQLQSSNTSAAYDAAADAADLGLASPIPSSILYPVDCQSLESPFEVCGSLSNGSQYGKSSWQVFTTPDVFNTLLFQVNIPSLPAGQKVGLRLFDGDLRWAAGNIVVLCDSLVTDASGQAARTFPCNSLRPNRVYSAELFFYNNFNAPVEVSVSTDALPVQKSFQSVCSGNSFILPWGTVATADSTYSDTLRTTGGCDSLVRRVTVQFDTARSVIDTTIYKCPIQNYLLPWGEMVNVPGIYSKTWHYKSGCDSVLYTVHLLPPTVPTQTDAINACPGSGYMLPWGQTVTVPGRYIDTLKKVNGCDSLVRSIDLSFTNNNEIRFRQDSSCNGNYNLPWGGIASTSGMYYDTIRRVNGCDSIINMLSLKIKNTVVQKDTVSLCSGNSYTLPWGTVADTSGVYKDTIRYVGTFPCDSLVQEITLLFNQPMVRNTQAFLCAGSNYTLPWGTIVNSPGIYKDTVKSTSGCDSLLRMVNLVWQPVSISDTSILLCEGSSYSLPWGGVADSDSIYTYIIIGASGCDSVRQTIRAHLLGITSDTLHFHICQGQSISLPWGQVVDTAGTYRDTLHYVNGCDSLRRVVYVTSAVLQIDDKPVTLCPGGVFTLPWGTVVDSPGIYKDTLRSNAGCDSLVRRFIIAKGTLAIDHKAISSCTSNYLLPWGQLATSPGIYRDTLRAVAGCDSLVREIDLSLVVPLVTITDTIICQGQSILLPGGSNTEKTGTYRDTIHAIGGCDSLIHITNLTVLSAKKDTATAFFCSGNVYTLPWGALTTVPGVYSDTTRSSRGCDSVVRTVILQVSTTLVETDSVSICKGATYTLPWGKTVQTGGLYGDTLRYANGCDSSIHIVNVKLLSTSIRSSKVTICNGASYTLPWGMSVSMPGVYSDTLRYVTGCDSLVRQVLVTAAGLPASWGAAGNIQWHLSRYTTFHDRL